MCGTPDLDDLGTPTSLPEPIEGVAVEIRKPLHGSVRPTDFHRHRAGVTAQPEVKPLGRLRKESVSGAKGFGEGKIPLTAQVDVDSGADRIAIAVGSFEPDCDESVARWQVVSEKSNSRRRAVGNEEIDVPVTIPVGPRNSAAVIG